MFRITRNDLQGKTDEQLSALFNQLNNDLSAESSSPVKQQVLKSALSLIQQEQACRHLKPK